jgi:hypothetical protein
VEEDDDVELDDVSVFFDSDFESPLEFEDEPESSEPAPPRRCLP